MLLLNFILKLNRPNKKMHIYRISKERTYLIHKKFYQSMALSLKTSRSLQLLYLEYSYFSVALSFQFFGHYHPQATVDVFRS